MERTPDASDQDAVVDTVEVPAHYAREIEEREKIADNCPIDVYTMSISPRWGWPWKLASYYEARPATRASSETMMIDSGYARRGNITDILAAASKYNADIITTPDVTPPCDGYNDITPYERALERYEDYMRVLGSSDWDGTVLLPVHLPFTDCIDELRNYDPGYVLGYEDDPAFDMRACTLDLVEKAGGVAIGGLKDLPVKERIAALRTVKKQTPAGTHIHALAPGTELEMIRELRDNPWLVDSLDVSTPERAVANNKLPDKTWTQRPHLLPAGTDSTTMRAQFSAATAVMLAYMLTPGLSIDESLEPGFDYQTVIPEEGIGDAVR